MKLKLRFAVIVLTVAVIPISFIQAPYPDELLLQHVASIVAIVLLSVVASMLPISWFSCFCLITFLWLHILGARWIYSFVPPASERLQQLGSLRPMTAAILAISVVLSIGTIYEILEWQPLTKQVR